MRSRRVNCISKCSRFLELWNIKYIPINLYPDESPEDFYIDGDCDMYGTDRSDSLLASKKTLMYPEEHIILPEIISKEPLGPAVKYGDQKWSDIVRWVVYVLFIAEEWEINSQNIDSFKENKDPKFKDSWVREMVKIFHIWVPTWI